MKLERLAVLTSVLLLFPVACSQDAGDDAAPTDEPPIESWTPGHHGSWTQVSAANPPLNVILITLDTARADWLSCYGFPATRLNRPIEHGKIPNPPLMIATGDSVPPTSPYLDALAADGILFENGMSPVPVTLPAHASILSGLYPFHHGVRNNGTYVLPESLQTMAELFKARGYATGAVLGAFPVARQFQTNQGFDHYDDEFPITSQRIESDTAQRTATDVTDRALEWVGAQSGPFFLWAHYFDPHFPYAPPEPYRTKYAADPYAGEIAYMDAEIGRLFDGLRAKGIYDRSVLVVVGDHGESLGEHGEMTHSIFIYRATQHVPYFVRVPNVAPFTDRKWRGRRIADRVSLVDVLPTAWNATGADRALLPAIDGKSLLPVIEGKGRGHGWLYYETLVTRLEYGSSELRSIENASHKYIRAPRQELFETATDPQERNNIAQRDSWIVEKMDGQLGTLLANETDTDPQVTMDPETIERLRSLGYLAGANAPQQTGGPLPDPKDMIWAYEAVNDARNAMAGHRPDLALAFVDSVLARHPNDPTAARIRGSALVRLERGQEAAQVYDALLASCQDCPDQLELLRNRAIASLTAGDLRDAEERVDALLETHPGDDEFLRLKAQILERGGRVDEARRTLQRDAQAANDPTSWSHLGDLEYRAGRLDRAEANYRKALELHPEHVASLVNLAELKVQQNQLEEARTLIDRAFAADPGNPDVLFRRGWFAKQDGRTDDAAIFYERAVAAGRSDPVVFHNLGNVYMQQGRMRDALATFTRAIETGEAPRETYVNMGVIYANMSQFAQAIQYWQSAIKMDPAHPSVPQIEGNIRMAQARLGGGGRPQ